MSDLVTRFNTAKRKIIESNFKRMNDKQREAVFTINGAVLILAGAGSGKTTVLVNRISNILKFGNAYYNEKLPNDLTEDDVKFLENYNGDDEDRMLSIIAGYKINPWNVLAITFTNKAANELRERIEAMIGEAAADVWAGTFHSICVKILRRHIDKIGYQNSFTIYDTDDSLRVIKEGMKALNIDEKMFSPKSMLSAIGREKDSLKTPTDVLKESEKDYKYTAIAKVYDYYQNRLKTANAVDFDDIINLTIQLFRENSDVLERYQNQFKYIMVDEYQDTNHAQYVLVSLLASGHQNICVVGDDDQSIYKFRGATIENILSFENQFKNAKVIKLEQNYRSTQIILDAANAVISNNTGRKGKELWTDMAGGENITVYRAEDEYRECAYIANTIEENVKNGAKYGDHAILYRMNSQSASLERFFSKSAIPHRIIGGMRFYERKEIRDVIAYLSVINNPNDSVRLKRIINEPKRGIGDATVASVSEIAEGLSLSMIDVMSDAENYPQIAKKAKPLKQFAEMINSLIEYADDSDLTDLFDEVLDKTGYLTYLKTKNEEGKDSVDRTENVMELASHIAAYQAETDEPSLQGFLEDVALISDIDNYDNSADAVVMMTMHSAKGLEFDNVFILSMEEGVFPSAMSMYNPEEIEEERRLAYVAITRAKKNLAITTAKSRMIFGKTSFNAPSRFLKEIPSELKTEKGATEKPRTATPISQPQSKTLSSAKTIGIMQGVKPQKSAVSYAVGESVTHKVFGSGVIVKAIPMGNDTMLEIAFDTVGTKKIMANYANLQKN